MSSCHQGEHKIMTLTSPAQNSKAERLASIYSEALKHHENFLEREKAGKD